MEQRTTRLGKKNRTQVVTIPLEYRFPEGVKEVFIRRVGQDLVLSPLPTDWSGFLASATRVSDDFMANVEAGRMTCSSQLTLAAPAPWW
jgi:antitoxin VapB